MRLKSCRVDPARRLFLAGLAGVAAAPVVRIAPAASIAVPIAAAGYRLTPHIRRYYAKANL